MDQQDVFGKVNIPNGKLYGKQTQRSLDHFSHANTKLPLELIYAYSYIKQAAAIVNEKKDLISKEKKDWIVKAAEKIRSGELDDQFPTGVFQTGSGTHTNMNVNEVICGLVSTLSDGKATLHSNDDVNLSQSTNDTFPAAIQIAATNMSVTRLLPALEKMIKTLESKQKEFSGVQKVARTHYMDAVLMDAGDELSAYVHLIKEVLEDLITVIKKDLSQLPLGGTAVGTGINAPKHFGKSVTKEISSLTKEHYCQSENLFAAISMNMPSLKLSSVLRSLSLVLIKIANDFSFLSSGPLAGIAELLLPQNEPGSSIMPGKVNPTQCEALRMAAIEVISNDQAITMGEMHNQLQLGLSRPVLAKNLLGSIDILSNIIDDFTEHCLMNISLNEKQIAKHVDNSFVYATQLSEKIGYDSAAKAVHKAKEEKLSLKEAVILLGLMTEKEYILMMKGS